MRSRSSRYKKLLIVLLFSLIQPIKAMAINVVDIQNSSEESIKKYIARLFVVGIETDYANSSSSSRLEWMLKDVGVGGIMLNAYNLPEATLRNSAGSRHGAFHYTRTLFHTIDGFTAKNEWEPLIYADFEGVRYSSVRYPLFSPPSALTISSAGNTRYSQLVGRVVGYQLTRLGVDVLLGPVFDSDAGSSQGEINTTISNRSFSEFPTFISLFAGSYIDGVTEMGVGVIGKHYPPYSAVSQNPHSEMAIYNGSLNRLEDDFFPFEANIEKLDGVMSSHLVVNELGSNTPFTFEKNAVESLLFNRESYERSEVLLMTDDLSDMNSITNYLDVEELSHSDAALRSFISGHDLLLFSHIGDRSSGGFSYSDLENSINEIYEYVENEQSGVERLVESYNKVESFYKRIKNKQVELEIYGSSDLDYESSQVLTYLEGSYANLAGFLSDLYNEAMLALKSLEFPSLDELGHDYSAGILSGAIGAEVFIEEFENSNRVIVKAYDEVGISQRAREAAEYAEDKDIVYMTISSVDDANTAHGIYLHYDEVFEKFVFLLHHNPKILPNQVVDNASHIYGTFSNTRESYEADIRLIKGEINANDVGRLPIELGKAGSLHTVDDYLPPLVEDSGTEVRLEYTTERERNLYLQLQGRTEELGFLRKQLELAEEMIRDTPDPDLISPVEINNRMELLWSSIFIFVFIIAFSMLSVINVISYFRYVLSQGKIEDQSFWRHFLDFIFRPKKAGWFKSSFFLLLGLAFFNFIFPNFTLLQDANNLVGQIAGWAGAFLNTFSVVYPGDYYLESV